MTRVLALAPHAGWRLAEIGVLLIAFAGIWLAAAQTPPFRLGVVRTSIAAIALAAGGVLLLTATHRDTSASRRSRRPSSPHARPTI